MTDEATSSQTINVIIHILNGIFFDGGNLEHMSYREMVNWSKIGMTEVRVGNQKDLKKYEISH